jgi:hypothetical protein
MAEMSEMSAKDSKLDSELDIEYSLMELKFNPKINLKRSEEITQEEEKTARELLKQVKKSFIDFKKAVEDNKEGKIKLLEEAFCMEYRYNKLYVRKIIFPDDILDDDKYDEARFVIKLCHEKHMPNGAKKKSFVTYAKLKVDNVDAVLVVEYHESNTYVLTDAQNEHVFVYLIDSRVLLMPKKICIYINGKLSKHTISIVVPEPPVDILRGILKKIIDKNYIKTYFSKHSKLFEYSKKIAFDKYSNTIKAFLAEYSNIPSFEEIEGLNEGVYNYSISNSIDLEFTVIDELEKLEKPNAFCWAKGYSYKREIKIKKIGEGEIFDLPNLNFNYFKNDFDLETSIANAVLVE